MGHVQHKYTKTYFTKINPDGSVADYGVEGYEEFLSGKIRDIDLSILKRLNFSGKRVLEFGFGRGEAIKYVLEHNATHYEGVDFSEHAISIASEFLKTHKLTVPPLHHADALAFLKEYKPIHDAQKKPGFDIILMLDFIEHVPRAELIEIMTLLRGVLSGTAVLAINTPAFRVDNDVISDDLSPLNAVDTVDTSDLIEETAGMHCNKYSIISLQEFMCACGFDAISEAHFYVCKNAPSTIREIPSFRLAWDRAVDQGRPLLSDWHEDTIEYAYQQQEVPRCHAFQQGRLNGISLLLTDFYQQFFPGGEYDQELFDDLDQQSTEGKTIFDIGGFMGVSSLLFSQSVETSGKVVCFEPNPWNRQRIRSNLSRNPDLTRRISLYGVALGDTAGKMEMLLSDNVDTGHSSTSQSVASHGTLTKEHLLSLGFYHQSVCLTTLDEFVRETGLVPHILKVDIEGAEHLFLTGAEATIRDHRPLIYMEVHSTFCAWVCSQKLQRLGYTLRLLLEENDGRIMIKAEPQQASLALEGSPALSRELFDLLRIERQRQSKLSADYFSVQLDLHNKQIERDNAAIERDNIRKELHSLQLEIINKQQELHNTQLELHENYIEINRLKIDLCNTQSSLEKAMNIVNHPFVKIQLGAYKSFKSLFKL